MHDDTTFIAKSGPMIEVLDQLRKVASLDTTILLRGESGTGKEVAARYLHSQHPTRRQGPFVPVHCGAIPVSLLESELFGHLRGAFTGADRDRQGKFEQAHGGTLFLDEISTMSAEAQVRLLRVLQERQVTPIGAGRPRPVDVRVIAATNVDLQKAVADGSFRLDLYYRLATFPVELPPLRERPGDLAPLVDHLVAKIASKMGRPSTLTVTPEVIEIFAGQEWLGNVRELENALEYAMVQAALEEELCIRHLPREMASRPRTTPSIHPLVTEDGLSFRTAITNLERELILQSMQLAHGNKARAAELLELKRTTFLEKLRRLEQDGSLGTPWSSAPNAVGSHR